MSGDEKKRPRPAVPVVASARAGVGSLSDGWLLAPLLGALAIAAPVAIGRRRPT